MSFGQKTDVWEAHLFSWRPFDLFLMQHFSSLFVPLSLSPCSSPAVSFFNCVVTSVHVKLY